MPRRPTITLGIAAACGVLALLVWLVAFRTGHGQAADLTALQRASGLRDSLGMHYAERLAHLCDPGPFALLSLSLTVLALITRGWRVALVVGAILLVPNVLTQELKTALAEDRPGGPLFSVDPASWPSGHSTAAMALAFAATVVAPRVLRVPVAMLGLAYAVMVGAVVVIFGWHLPSDVVGGFAIAGGAAAIGVFVLELSRPAATTALPSRSRRATG